MTTSPVVPPCPYSVADLLAVRSQWAPMLEVAHEQPVCWVWTDEGYDLQDVRDPAVWLPWNESSILPLRAPARAADATITGNATEARFTWTPYRTTESVTVSRLVRRTAGDLLGALSGEREFAVYQRNRFVRRWTVVAFPRRYQPPWPEDDPRRDIAVWLRVVASSWQRPELLVPFEGMWPALRPITERQIPPVT